MIERTRRLRLAVVVGAVVLSAGRVVDLQWHASNDGFETGSDQLQAHWLAWLGALMLLVAAAGAVRRPAYRSPGFVVLLASTTSYAGMAIWHFSLHQQLPDPELPHVLLALSQLVVYVGCAMVVAGLVVPHCREKYLGARSRLPDAMAPHGR